MSSTTSKKIGDGSAHPASGGTGDEPSAGMGAKLAFAWAFVGIPLAYGIYETAKKASALFTG